MSQNSVIPFQITFNDFFTRKGGWGAFGVAFKQLIMDEHLTHYLDVEVGIFHLPDLAPLQLHLRNSVLRFHNN